MDCLFHHPMSARDRVVNGLQSNNWHSVVMAEKGRAENTHYRTGTRKVHGFSVGQWITHWIFIVCFYHFSHPERTSTGECSPTPLLLMQVLIMDFKFGASFQSPIVQERTCVSFVADSCEKWEDGNQFVFSQTQKSLCAMAALAISTMAEKLEIWVRVKGFLSTDVAFSCLRPDFGIRLVHSSRRQV